MAWEVGHNTFWCIYREWETPLLVATYKIGRSGDTVHHGAIRRASLQET